MASYRDKLNQRQMVTESGKIAWCIQFIEGCGKWKFKKDWIMTLRKHEALPLFDNVYLRESDCESIYVIFKPLAYRPNAYLCKYVQTDMTYDQYVDMLDAQPWQYI